MAEDFEIQAMIADLPLLGRQNLNFHRSDVPTDRGATRATILIGRNGSGKSMLLRDITMTLRAYSSPRGHGRPRVAISSELTVKVDQDTWILPTFREARSSREFRLEAQPYGAVPTRVIALSFTPFDKFPVGDRLTDSGELDLKSPFYVYLGFRQEPGLSPRSRLLRSLDALIFAGSTPQSDNRATATLHAIGYGPTIEVSYVPVHSIRAVGSIREKSLAPWREALVEQYGLRNPRPKEDRRFTYKIDLSDGRYDQESRINYDGLRELVHARLLTVESVRLRRASSDEPVELLELSSGELSILSGFMGLAAYLEDGCLILIDEPENSLHPEWQARYISMLEAVLSRHSGCHYVVATHSPLIVSGAAATSDVRSNGITILRLDQSPVSVSGELVADESPDSTLVTAFDVVTSGNNYIKQVVLEAMSLVQSGKAKSDRAKDLASFLSSCFEAIPEDDAVRPLAAAVVDSIHAASEDA